MTWAELHRLREIGPDSYWIALWYALMWLVPAWGWWFWRRGRGK